MFVDKDNFEEQYEEISKILAGDLYAIAMDLEFTGLRILGGETEKEEDIPDERYQKMKKIARNYNII